ncbi:MAG: helix-turn-helix domain-containing protein [Bacilli bacterium]|nr:helix-turn-helix domain-containing protein [Bacilli bacterium]
MLVDTFSNRLNKIMTIRNIKPIELSSKTGISKSQISHWLAGTYKAKQDSLTILAEFFDVDETWLMGFDVPMKSERKKLSKEEEKQLLKEVLTRKGFLDENEEMSEEDFNNLIAFAKANKNFIMKKKDD